VKVTFFSFCLLTDFFLLQMEIEEKKKEEEHQMLYMVKYPSPFWKIWKREETFFTLDSKLAQYVHNELLKKGYTTSIKSQGVFFFSGLFAWDFFLIATPNGRNFEMHYVTELDAGLDDLTQAYALSNNLLTNP